MLAEKAQLDIAQSDQNEKSSADSLKVSLPTEAEGQKFAQALAQSCLKSNVFEQGVVLYLLGNLGAGKSFTARHFIQYFAPNQKVKSPTYTLVESYPLSVEDGMGAMTAHHFDLYRLCDPEELEFIGIRDLLTPPYAALIEWPQKGEPFTPEADLELNLQPKPYQGGQAGREALIMAKTSKGLEALQVLKELV